MLFGRREFPWQGRHYSGQKSCCVNSGSLPGQRRWRWPGNEPEVVFFCRSGSDGSPRRWCTSTLSVCVMDSPRARRLEYWSGQAVLEVWPNAPDCGPMLQQCLANVHYICPQCGSLYLSSLFWAVMYVKYFTWNFRNNAMLLVWLATSRHYTNYFKRYYIRRSQAIKGNWKSKPTLRTSAVNRCNDHVAEVALNKWVDRKKVSPILHLARAVALTRLQAFGAWQLGYSAPLARWLRAGPEWGAGQQEWKRHSCATRQ